MSYTLGHGKAGIIKSFSDKKIILNYLFKSINLANYRFQMLKSIDQLEFLKKEEHYVSPNFYGFNYLILFMKLNGKNKSFLIDRRKLKYNQESIDLKTVLILDVNIKCECQIYDGTIMDGKLIKLPSNKYVFILNDCYLLYGKNIKSQKLEKKYDILNKVLSTDMEEKPCYNFDIKINKLYDYTKLDELINKIIPSAKLPINGIVFYPKYSGNILIFSENSNKLKNKSDKIEITNKRESIPQVQVTNFKTNQVEGDESYHIVRDLVSYLKSRNIVSKEYYNDEDLKELYLKKSDIPDVYHLLESKESKNIGIAHIPNMTISQELEKIFENESIKKFSCYYNKQFKKWCPLL